MFLLFLDSNGNTAYGTSVTRIRILFIPTYKAIQEGRYTSVDRVGRPSPDPMRADEPGSSLARSIARARARLAGHPARVRDGMDGMGSKCCCCCCCGQRMRQTPPRLLSSYICCQCSWKLLLRLYSQARCTCIYV